MCEEFKGVDSPCRNTLTNSGVRAYSDYQNKKAMNYKTKDKIFNWALLLLTLAGLGYLISVWL